MIVARGPAMLDDAITQLKSHGGDAIAVAADVTKPEDIDRLATTVHSAWGGLDMFCHCAGRSMRGTVLATTAEDFRDLWETNFLSAVRCVQVFANLLVESRGHVVLIGSLASKVAAGYLGAYPASKFPFAAFAQQLRIEMRERGLHTLLVCPGPIRRDDPRPAAPGMPIKAPGCLHAAHQPGGGAKVQRMNRHRLAEKILNACEMRRAELVVPWSPRLLFVAAQMSPRFGDWLLRRHDLAG